MKKNNKNDFVKKWAAFVIAVAIFFVGGLLSGISIAKKANLSNGQPDVSNLESCKAKFGDTETVVTHEPATELLSVLGTVQEVNENGIKIAYQAQPFSVSGGDAEQKELQVLIDKNTVIQFSQKLANGDENITQATSDDLAADSIVYVFSDDNILDNQQVTATKIKIIK